MTLDQLIARLNALRETYPGILPVVLLIPGNPSVGIYDAEGDLQFVHVVGEPIAPHGGTVVSLVASA